METLDKNAIIYGNTIQDCVKIAQREYNSLWVYFSIEDIIEECDTHNQKMLFLRLKDLLEFVLEIGEEINSFYYNNEPKDFLLGYEFCEEEKELEELKESIRESIIMLSQIDEIPF